MDEPSHQPTQTREKGGASSEPLRPSEPSDRAVEIFGAEVALGAVLDHDIEETGGENEAGEARAGAPVVFDAVLSVVGVGLKVHVSLVEISSCFESKRATYKGITYSDLRPGTAVAFAILVPCQLCHPRRDRLRFHRPYRRLCFVQR